MAFAEPGFLQGLGDLRREGGRKEETTRGTEQMEVETAYKFEEGECNEERVREGRRDGSLPLTLYVSKLTTADLGPRREAGACTLEEEEAEAAEDEEGLDEEEGLKGVENRGEVVPEEEGAEEGGVEEGAGREEETRERL